MSKYGNLLFSKGTSQSQSLSSKQTKNNAGGFVFTLDKWKRLERFLILGSDSNTYYQKAHELTKENASVVDECWTENHGTTAYVIADISLKGRAPKNSPAIFALALGCIHPNIKVRQEAFGLLNLVCRTSTHLFEFVDTCKALKKGWGRGMKNAVADWYNDKSDEQLAYQLVKYRQREGYTHRDLLRLAHPKAETETRKAMFDWLCGREDNGDLPDIIKAHRWAIACTEVPTEPLPELNNISAMCHLIQEHNLPWEALPTWANTKPEVWKAMLPKMPLTALIRNLGNMTRLSVFGVEDGSTDVAISHFSEKELKKARIHPFNILTAFKTYASGRGFRGSNSWTPVPLIYETLDRAFYDSFKFIEPSNKRIMLALDVSGSMNSAMNDSPLTVREASSAMAMATLAVEENAFVTGFTSLHAHNYGMDITPLAITKGMSLNQVCSYTDRLPFSGTDCALPMLYAMEENLSVDAFVVYTDSETWAGHIHPVEALRKYREMSGLNAKLVVVGMTSTGFSIADPNDPGMLDVVGFDSNAPSIIANFLSDEPILLEDNSEQHPRQTEEENTNPAG